MPRVESNQQRRWDTDLHGERDFIVLGRTENSFCYWDVQYLSTGTICHYSGGVIAQFSDEV